MSQKVVNEMSQPFLFQQLVFPAHHFYFTEILIFQTPFGKFKKLFRPFGILNRNTSYPSEISEFSNPLQKILSTYRWCNKIIQTPRKFEQQYILPFRSFRILKPPSENFFNRGCPPCKLSNFVIPLENFTFLRTLQKFHS